MRSERISVTSVSGVYGSCRCLKGLFWCLQHERQRIRAEIWFSPELSAHNFSVTQRRINFVSTLRACRIITRMFSPAMKARTLRLFHENKMPVLTLSIHRKFDWQVASSIDDLITIRRSWLHLWFLSCTIYKRDFTASVNIACWSRRINFIAYRCFDVAWRRTLS